MRVRNGLAIVAVLAVGLGFLAQQAPAQDNSREALERQLQEQQARNEALKQQVSKLEALLKTDVCKDPAAIEAAQKETQALLSAKLETPAAAKP